MQYQFNVQEPNKTFLLNGIKTIEGRLNKGKFASLKVGDTLSFESGEMFLVNELTYHKTFHDLIVSFGRDCIIPDAKSDEEAENTYYKFFTHEDEKKFGVVGIHVKRIENMKVLHN